MLQCCNPNNFIIIADALKELIENPLSSSLIKSKGFYPSFILFTEGFYEYALSEMDNQNIIPKEINDKVKYFKDLLKNKSSQLSDSTINLINQYLQTFNVNLIPDIRDGLEKNMPTNETKINDIKYNIATLEEYIINYSKEDGSVYTPGKSLLKVVLKLVFINTFCNISQTAKTSNDIINEMGNISNITDMLKGGSISGLITSIAYFITVIVLIIMGILNKF
jgi:hypothetical protein